MAPSISTSFARHLGARGKAWTRAKRDGAEHPTLRRAVLGGHMTKEKLTLLFRRMDANLNNEVGLFEPHPPLPPLFLVLTRAYP